MLARNLHIPHELVCCTDDPAGIDPDIRCEPITEFTDAPRCQRRMAQYGAEFASRLGSRILSIDLDCVITGNLTGLVDRPEPVVLWRVGFAQVYSGSFQLFDAGALDGLYRAYAADPAGFARRAAPHGTPSDQPMLNYFLRGKSIPHWTEADGICTFFGRGYERKEHLGVGPNRRELPSGTRLVVLGSADKSYMDEASFDWIRQHWR